MIPPKAMKDELTPIPVEHNYAFEAGVRLGLSIVREFVNHPKNRLGESQKTRSVRLINEFIDARVEEYSK